MRRPSFIVILATFAILTVIWGTTWAAIRIGLRSIPPFTGVALRFGLASAALLFAAWLKRVPLGRTSRERWLWLVVTVFTFCISYGVVYWCEQWVPSALASVLFATFPLFVGIGAHLMLPAERLTAAAALGTVLGFVGISVIFSEDFSLLGGRAVASAGALMLISPFASAVGSLAVKRWGHDVHPLSLTSVPMGLTALVMGALALAFEGGQPLRFDAVSLGSLVYLGLFGTALTFTLYYWLLAQLPATVMALISYTSPVVAVLAGTLFLDERFTARTVLGSFLVLGGVALAAQAHPSRPQKSEIKS